MARNLSKSILLLFFGVVICCGIYPFVLWAIGQMPFLSRRTAAWSKALTGNSRLAAHRPALHEGRVLPAEAFGRLLRRLGLRLVGAGGLELRPARQGRPHAGTYRDLQERSEGGQARGAGHREPGSERISSRATAHRRPVGGPPQRLGPRLGQGGPDARSLRGRMGEDAPGPRRQMGQGEPGYPEAAGDRPRRHILREFLEG